MSKSMRVVAVALFGAVLFGAMSFADHHEGEPKHTIKDVMKKAMKGKTSLRSKVIAGEATAEEKKELLDLYISLVESKPEKGEMDSWHTLAGKSVLAAAKVVVGREGAVKELEAATNCAACHKAHKG